ncbi:MAG: CDP-alcohol phosphatidyltransferase family protein [Dehalococcoidales bacterium]|nr:MAG: CDP-alcohol phosphatidyltransferase family protein [Dehalococcoidales bacterium]
MTTLASVRKNLAFYLTQPVVRLLARTGITPNTVTWLGFLIAIGAGVLAGIGHPFVAGFVVLVGGFFDIIDGALARHTGSTSRFGAILDSTLDRAGEAVVLLGLLVFYTLEQSTAGVVVVGVVWLMSLLVSYIRARAEAMGLECEVGIFTRAERVVLLALGLLLSQVGEALLIILSVIAALSFITVVQRLRNVWRQTKTG